jgi:predicted transcriptional regulator
MANSRRIDLDEPAPVDEDEDEETLAAIDEGIRDAEAGRTVPMEEVRKLLPKWITASTSGIEMVDNASVLRPELSGDKGQS